MKVWLMVLPLLTPLPREKKSDSRWLFISALNMLLGAALWRMNYSLIMYNPGRAAINASHLRKNCLFQLASFLLKYVPIFLIIRFIPCIAGI